jgi:hypothetical protein
MVQFFNNNAKLKILSRSDFKYDGFLGGNKSHLFLA